MSRQIGPESLPILPLLDTEEILESMGGTWRQPPETNRHSAEAIDDIVLQWISFCEYAKTGQKIVENFKKGQLSGDLLSLRSNRAFMKSLESEDVSFPDIIVTIESAFAQLLSRKAKKQVSGLGIKPKLRVDGKLRNQIGVLVSNMRPITQSYIYERNKEWKEIYGED